MLFVSACANCIISPSLTLRSNKNRIPFVGVFKHQHHHGFICLINIHFFLLPKRERHLHKALATFARSEGSNLRDDVGGCVIGVLLVVAVVGGGGHCQPCR